MSSTTAGVLIVAGSASFLVGAGIGVPRVFTEPDREEKARMLAEGLLWWRLSQPLYALGALLAAVGVGVLASDGDGGSGVWFVVSCGLLVLGALAWSWSVYLRAVSPREFALGRLPGWPFATYVWLTLAGLVPLGVGLVSRNGASWPGWLVLVADAVLVVAYVRYRDIPPFCFYVVLAVVGFVLL